MQKKYSILMVDDDKFLLDMYSKKFAQYEIHPDFASSSSDALQKMRDGAKPDIVVLDIIMPTMDGLELLETMRKEKLCEHSVVIFLTNESESTKIEKAKSLGVAGYIVKATSVPSEVVEEIIKIADAHQKS